MIAASKAANALNLLPPVEGDQRYDTALTVLVRSVAVFAISLLPDDDCTHPKPAFPLQ